MGPAGVEAVDPMSAPKLRGMEQRLAEDMTSVLDFVSRVQDALDAGNWHYLFDKAGQLARAAGNLQNAARYEIDERQLKPSTAARPAAITAAVQSYSQHYRAGRLLYSTPEDPARADRQAATEAAVARVMDGGQQG
jgi:hypothetical protein